MSSLLKIARAGNGTLYFELKKLRYADVLHEGQCDLRPFLGRFTNVISSSRIGTLM